MVFDRDAYLLGVSVFLLFVPSSLSNFKNYNTHIPDECLWHGTKEGDQTLVCRLKTINSEFENTNLSVIENHGTVRLRLECNNSLFYQSSLNADSFQVFKELRSLTIEYCKLKNLNSSNFRGLVNLNELAIRTHNIDWLPMSLEISPYTFDEIAKLSHLDLSLNSIKKLPGGLICSLSLLQHLNLSYNQIQNIDFLNTSQNLKLDLKSCGSSVIDLDLSFNLIKVLPSSGFFVLHQLSSLSLTGNIVDYIEDGAFAGLHVLTFLDLSNNKLRSIPPELFAGTSHLKQLHLKNNSIDVLPPGLFKNLKNLDILDISFNELTSQWINEASFAGMKQLTQLNLSGNKINRINVDAFNHLKELKTLKLEYNLIETISSSPFEELKQLSSLTLSNNHMKAIASETFRGLSKLMVLSLDYNLISNIHFNSFKSLSEMEDLHLNSNKLYEIPEALIHLTSLKTLDLGENFISNIDNTSLSKINTLFGLRLTDNAINSISRNTFKFHISLRILNLSQNKIVNIENKSFQHNIQLQAIRLDNNDLKTVSDVFAELPNLIWLNISNNKLVKFDYTTMPNSLQWLDISGNEIDEIRSYYGSKIESNLVTLDASFNVITEINAASLLNSIETVYLNNNQIKSISPYVFFQKFKLRKVDLRNNKLSSLEENALRISPVSAGSEIPKFFISGNSFRCDCKLDWLAKYDADSRSRPDIADLSSIHCNVSFERSNQPTLLIDKKLDDFLCIYKSQCFALCHCCEFEACDCKMDCPDRCICYHDQSWTSNVVDCSRVGYKSITPLHIPMDSTELYLDGNKFVELASHTFIGRKRLKILLLNHSHIEELHNRTFYGLVDLEILKLNQNKISTLFGDEFQGLENLKELYLNHNKIRSIHESTFTHIYHLKVLHLYQNQLVKFAVWNYLPPYLTAVSLSDNPWSCDCSFLEKFHFYLITHSFIYDKQKLMCTIQNEKNVTSHAFPYSRGTESFSIYFANEYFSGPGALCNRGNWSDPSNRLYNHKSPHNISDSPNHQNNRNITKLMLTPPENGYLQMLIIVLGSCFGLIVLSFLLFVYKEEIRVRCFSRFGIRLFYCRDEGENDRQVLFDAFVSYSSKDDSLVHQELAPVLEQSYPRYKICLHHRDFPESAYITEHIMQAISMSRRTIIIVSENFIKYEWNRFEYKAAFHSILQDRRHRLIVILLGNVPQYGMDADLDLYLKANKYLMWGEKLFWKKLRFGLPDVVKTQKSRSNANNSPYTEDGIHLTLNNIPLHQRNVSNHDVHFLLQQHLQRPKFRTLHHNNDYDQSKINTENNMLQK